MSSPAQPESEQQGSGLLPPHSAGHGAGHAAGHGATAAADAGWDWPGDGAPSGTGGLSPQEEQAAGQDGDWLAARWPPDQDWPTGAQWRADEQWPDEQWRADQQSRADQQWPGSGQEPADERGTASAVSGARALTSTAHSVAHEAAGEAADTADSAAPAGAAPGAAARRWAMLAYLGLPFVNFLAPLIVYLGGRRSPFVRRHAAQALNLSLTVLLYEISALIFGSLLALDSVTTALRIVAPLAAALLLAALIYLVLAAAAAHRGVFRRIPRWLCATMAR